MRFNDLEFGWRSISFTLFDIELDNSIVLEKENGHEKLEYGELQNIKYSKIRRTLIAKAKFYGKYQY